MASFSDGFPCILGVLVRDKTVASRRVINVERDLETSDVPINSKNVVQLGLTEPLGYLFDVDLA